MRKIILYGIVCLLLAFSASAYDTVISIGVIEMNCNTCASPASLTSITGATGTGIACVASTTGCTCLGSSSNNVGSSITEGTTYSTGTASLTSGTTYYACLKLTENTVTGANTYALSNCAGGATSTTYKFALTGTSCGGLFTGYVGVAGTATAIIFPFTFVA